MIETSFVLLYVAAPQDSARWYAALLGKPIVEQSPTFAMLPLKNGLMLGLWRRDTILPSATAATGGSEIAFTVADAAVLQSTHADWVAKGTPILLPPTEMDFGLTFVGTDPDGHRLRVFVPAAA